MENIFVLVYRFFKKHRMLFWCSLCIIFLLPAIITTRIHLEEDITSIIPKDEKTQTLNELFQQSGLMDKLILTVSGTDAATTDPDSLVTYTDELAQAVKAALPAHTADVSHQVDDEKGFQLLGEIHQHLPVFLEPNDYKTIDSLISPNGVKATLEKNYHLLRSPAGLALKQFIVKDPSGISHLALKKLQLLQFDQQFELYDSHILTRDLKKAILFITPAFPKNNTKENAIMLEGLDRIIDSLSTVHPSIRAHYFGGTAVAVGNAIQLRKDTRLTLGITVLFLVLFFAFYFRKAAAPFLILLPAVFGALFALAWITLTKGSISVIALGTGSVILGIAVNYSLHLLNHQRHEGDMETVLRDLSHPMTIGSITTVGGFLCMQWVESEMLRDLGLFGALSLIGAALFSLVFLPQLISRKNEKQHASPGWLDRFAARKFEANKKLVWLILALTIVFALFAGGVEFETDLNRMNFMPASLKAAEAEMNELNAFALQSIYIVSSGKDLESALRRNEKIAARLNELSTHATVRKYSGVSAVLVSDSLQRQRIQAWNEYWTPAKREALLNALEKEGLAIGYKPTAFEPVKVMLNAPYLPVKDTVVRRLAAGLLDNYIIRQDTGIKLITLVKTTPDQKAAVYKAFNGSEKTAVVDMQYVTGRLVDMVRKDFNSISWMAASIVFIVLLVSFGRIELTLIAFIPMLITWIWILGIMTLLHIPFNIVNIIISALIFGLGDDYSLFTLDGLLQEYKTGRRNLDSFKSSILLSAITTIIGLGVLIFAKHPSLRSIAWMAITGILCVVVISQVMIPVLFKMLITNRTEKGNPPMTAWNFFLCCFVGLSFLICALVLSLAAFFILLVNPFAGRKAKYFYHVIISKVARFQMFIMGNMKKTILNSDKENFTRPAVIISNHQSILDILFMISLNPRIILLTNEWVWRSPLFGFVIRMADYFPVARGVENNIGQLAEKFKQGYSIVVFPEGTRSPDGNMKRFHKGAFFLAEQLNADILPIMLHGTGRVMRKGDLMVKNAHATLEFLPRIPAGDKSFGEGYAARTKSISRYFKDLYQQRRESYEQGDWFRGELMSNYIYKGPTLEWYLRIKTSLEHNYQTFINEIPLKGKILDMGCGYGAMSYMLHFTGKERDITGIDYDDEKIAVASLCYSRNESIRFLHGDARDISPGMYDAIIISDVLHYLQPIDQTLVMEKCMQQILPGGKLIIREGNTEMEGLHRRTRLSEIFSTRIVGFNKTETGNLHFLSGAKIRATSHAQGFGCREIRDSKVTSNVIFVLERKGNHEGN